MEGRATPSGWYADPQGRFEYRYFNGVQWTSDVSVNGHRYVDSATGSQPPLQEPRRPRGMAVASFVTGLAGVVAGWVPFIFVLAAGSAIAAIIFGIIGLRTARRHDGYGRGFAIAGLALAPVALAVCVAGFYLSRTVVHEVRDFVDPGPYKMVVDTCKMSGGRATLTGTIHNLDNQAHDYRIDIAFEDGITRSTVTVAVSHVTAGATVPVSAATNLTGTAVTCQVAHVYGPLPFDVES